jgi:hypothetical protein
MTTTRNVVVAIVVVLVVVIVYLTRPKRENFGGVIKKIRHIPFNDCKRICEGYYQKCIVDYKDADPSWCERRFRQACPSECYYSVYQRM